MKKKLSTVVVLTLLMLLATVGSLWAAPAQQDDIDEIDAAAERVAEIQASEPTLRDDFSSDNNGWTEDDDGLGNGLVIDEEAYFLRIETALEQPLLVGTAERTVENFLFTVEAMPVAFPDYSEMGVAFRADAEESYFFLVSSDGEYALIRAEAGDFELVVEAEFSPLIELDEEGVIELGVLAEGEAVALLVNGEVVATVEDVDLLDGEVGVFLAQPDVPPLEVSFDNFTLWDLDELADAPSDPITTTGDLATTDDMTTTGEIAAADDLTATANVTEAEEITEVDEITETEAVSETGNGTIPSLAQQLETVRGTEPLYYDEFRRDSGDWSLADEDEQTIAYAERALNVEVNEGGMLYFSLNEAAADLATTSYLLEVEATTDSEEGAGSYDVLFNYQDDNNYYDFYVVDDSYGLLKRTDGEWKAPVEESATDALLLEADDVNRLGVLVRGTTVSLLINGELVAQVEDDALMPGAIGLGAELLDAEGSFRVSFDNLDLWEVEEMAIAAPEVDADMSAEMNVSERLDEIRSNEPDAVNEFRRDDGAWPTLEEEDAESFYTGRAYHIQLNADALLRLMYEGEPFTWDNFLAEVDTMRVEGSGNYGLSFRYTDDEHYYLFSLRDDTFSLRMPAADGEWEALIDWTTSDAIIDEFDEINRLGVLAQGNQITLLINDEVVAQLEDDALTEGAVGLAAGTFDEDFHEVAFDNLEIWTAEAEVVDDDVDALDESDKPDVDEEALIDAEELAAIRSEEPLYYNDFRRETNGWAELDQETYSTVYADRAYELTVTEANHRASVTNSEAIAELELTNYLIEVDVFSIDVLPEDGYGLVVRNEEASYLFAIGAGGYVLGRESDEAQEELISGTSTAIEEGAEAVNRLGVLVQEGTITLLINGEPVAATTVDLAETTAVGFVGLTGEEEGLVVAFDELEIWSLE